MDNESIDESYYRLVKDLLGRDYKKLLFIPLFIKKSGFSPK